MEFIAIIMVSALLVSAIACGVGAYLIGLRKGRMKEQIDSRQQFNTLQKEICAKDQMLRTLQTQANQLREKEEQLKTLDARVAHLQKTECLYSNKIKPLEEKLRQRGREITLLSEASLFLTSGDFQKTCDTVAFRVGMLPDVKFARLYMLNESGTMLRLVAGYNISEHYLKMIKDNFELSVDNIPAGMAVKEKAPYVVNDVAADAYFSRWSAVTAMYDYRCYVAAPLFRTHRILGVLEIFFEKADTLSKDTLNIINIIANLGAMAIENCLFTGKLEQLSVTDGLTGTYNHAFLLKTFETEIARAARYNHNLAFIMFDLDNFKPINDTLGHLKGDEVLCSVALRMKQSVRATDYVCRYGGDEFAILLPETGRAETLEVIAKVGKALESVWAGLPDGTGVSIGYALYPEDAKTATDLINSADAAVYQEKRRKKSR